MISGFTPQPLPRSFVIISGSELPLESWQIKCQAQGGQLARIKNVADQQIAEAVIARVRAYSVLIDGKRSKSKSFTYLDGKPLTYT